MALIPASAGPPAGPSVAWGEGAYDILSTIGQGTYGIVLKARHKGGQVVAIKQFKSSDNDEKVRKTAMREVNVLRRLTHVNIVTLLDVFRRKRRLYLVFEYCEKTLLEAIEEESGRAGLDVDAARRYSYQLFRALAYMHGNGIIHRDLKPENVLLTGSRVLKLIDFGFARALGPAGAKYTDYVSTRWYRSPALLVTDGAYGADVDVWSLGCILGEMVAGRPLFPGSSDVDQLHRITRCLGPMPPALVEATRRSQWFSGAPQLAAICNPERDDRYSLERLLGPRAAADPVALDLIVTCLQYDAAKVPSVAVLLRHPFFSGMEEWVAGAAFKAAVERDVAASPLAKALKQRPPSPLQRAGTVGAVQQKPATPGGGVLATAPPGPLPPHLADIRAVTPRREPDPFRHPALASTALQLSEPTLHEGAGAAAVNDRRAPVLLTAAPVHGALAPVAAAEHHHAAGQHALSRGRFSPGALAQQQHQAHPQHSELLQLSSAGHNGGSTNRLLRPSGTLISGDCLVGHSPSLLHWPARLHLTAFSSPRTSSRSDGAGDGYSTNSAALGVAAPSSPPLGAAAPLSPSLSALSEVEVTAPALRAPASADRACGAVVAVGARVGDGAQPPPRCVGEAHVTSLISAPRSSDRIESKAGDHIVGVGRTTSVGGGAAGDIDVPIAASQIGLPGASMPAAATLSRMPVSGADSCASDADSVGAGADLSAGDSIVFGAELQSFPSFASVTARTHPTSSSWGGDGGGSSPASGVPASPPRLTGGGSSVNGTLPLRRLDRSMNVARAQSLLAPSPSRACPHRHAGASGRCALCDGLRLPARMMASVPRAPASPTLRTTSDDAAGGVKFDVAAEWVGGVGGGPLPAEEPSSSRPSTQRAMFGSGVGSDAAAAAASMWSPPSSPCLGRQRPRAAPRPAEPASGSDASAPASRARASRGGVDLSAVLSLPLSLPLPLPPSPIRSRARSSQIFAPNRSLGSTLSPLPSLLDAWPSIAESTPGPAVPHPSRAGTGSVMHSGSDASTLPSFSLAGGAYSETDAGRALLLAAEAADSSLDAADDGNDSVDGELEGDGAGAHVTAANGEGTPASGLLAGTASGRGPRNQNSAKKQGRARHTLGPVATPEQRRIGKRASDAASVGIVAALAGLMPPAQLDPAVVGVIADGAASNATAVGDDVVGVHGGYGDIASPDDSDGSSDAGSDGSVDLDDMSRQVEGLLGAAREMVAAATAPRLVDAGRRAQRRALREHTRRARKAARRTAAAEAARAIKVAAAAASAVNATGAAASRFELPEPPAGPERNAGSPGCSVPAAAASVTESRLRSARLASNAAGLSGPDLDSDEPVDPIDRVVRDARSRQQQARGMPLGLQGLSDWAACDQALDWQRLVIGPDAEAHWTQRTEAETAPERPHGDARIATRAAPSEPQLRSPALSRGPVAAAAAATAGRVPNVSGSLVWMGTTLDGRARTGAVSGNLLQGIGQQAASHLTASPVKHGDLTAAPQREWRALGSPARLPAAQIPTQPTSPGFTRGQTGGRGQPPPLQLLLPTKNDIERKAVSPASGVATHYAAAAAAAAVAEQRSRTEASGRRQSLPLVLPGSRSASPEGVQAAAWRDAVAVGSRAVSPAQPPPRGYERTAGASEGGSRGKPSQPLTAMTSERGWASVSLDDVGVAEDTSLLVVGRRQAAWRALTRLPASTAVPAGGRLALGLSPAAYAAGATAAASSRAPAAAHTAALAAAADSMGLNTPGAVAPRPSTVPVASAFLHGPSYAYAGFSITSFFKGAAAAAPSAWPAAQDALHSAFPPRSSLDEDGLPAAGEHVGLWSPAAQAAAGQRFLARMSHVSLAGAMIPAPGDACVPNHDGREPGVSAAAELQRSHSSVDVPLPEVDRAVAGMGGALRTSSPQTRPEHGASHERDDAADKNRSVAAIGPVLTPSMLLADADDKHGGTVVAGSRPARAKPALVSPLRSYAHKGVLASGLLDALLPTAALQPAGTAAPHALAQSPRPATVPNVATLQRVLHPSASLFQSSTNTGLGSPAAPSAALSLRGPSRVLGGHAESPASPHADSSKQPGPILPSRRALPGRLDMPTSPSLAVGATGGRITGQQSVILAGESGSGVKTQPVLPPSQSSWQSSAESSSRPVVLTAVRGSATAAPSAATQPHALVQGRPGDSAKRPLPESSRPPDTVGPQLSIGLMAFPGSDGARTGAVAGPGSGVAPAARVPPTGRALAPLTSLSAGHLHARKQRHG